MKKFQQNLLKMTFALVLVVAPFSMANAQAVPVITTTYVTATSSADRDSLLALIQSLTKQVEELQKQLLLKRERDSFLQDGLRFGVKDNNDVIKIQKLLANDPSVYPEGFITGYYGQMTVNAVMNFQRRHNIDPTGEVDPETKSLLQNYLKKPRGQRFPY